VSAEPTSTASPAEIVSGFLAVISIAASLLAIFWDPLRLSPFAVLLALITVVMAPKDARLPLAAVAIGAVCFIVGMTIAVTTNHALY
jgi:hypothetical protein